MAHLWRLRGQEIIKSRGAIIDTCFAGLITNHYAAFSIATEKDKFN